MNIKLKAFSLYDNKVKAYGKPLFFNNVHECKADLASALQYDKSEVNPINYDLFLIGEYDNQSGVFTKTEKPEHLCNLRSLMPKTETKEEENLNQIKETA